MFRLISLLVLASIWLGASFALRYALMEAPHWTELCAAGTPPWPCEVRHGLGLLIHFKLIAGPALGLASVAFLLPGRPGWWLAVVALFPAITALALYGAGLGAFALVLAALRLVREGDGRGPVFVRQRADGSGACG